MANKTPSRLGQVNAADDALALFLKVFPGEVMGAFEEANIMFGAPSQGTPALHRVRDITHGKSAQFPATGKASASYHTPGTELNGANAINHNERVINIDSSLIADTFIAEIDEAMNHYEVRDEYATQLGQALAVTGDKQLFQVLLLAARSAATVTGLSGGTKLTNASAATDGDILASMVFDASQAMDEKDVPDADGVRHIAFRPAQYHMLTQSTKVLNRDWGGEGSYARAKLPVLANFDVHKSNHVPNAIVAADAGTNNTYDGDFSTSVGVAWHPSAVGTVRLRGLKTERQYLIQNQGHLMVAKYLMGHGILRPESAVEIATA